MILSYAAMSIFSAVLALAVACFSIPRMLLPKNLDNSDNVLLFDGVCNLCDGYVHDCVASLHVGYDKTFAT